MDNKTIRFNAAVTDDCRHDIHLVAKKLESLGCEITQVLSVTGIISGSVTGRSLESLQIDGVKSIDYDRDVRSL